MQKNNKPSLKERFRYWFDNHMSRGSLGLIRILLAVTIFVIAVITVIILICGFAEDLDGKGVFWETLSTVINEWIQNGHEVSIITGRPFEAYEPSRAWLDGHGLQDVKLFCLDKYGRENFLKNSGYSLKLEDYLKMHFDFAVEDSPSAFKFFDHLPNLKVMVFDRPWNREVDLASANYCRCYDWESIRIRFSKEIGG